MLYLVDKPLADVAFRTAREDPDPTIVLIQDGVLLDPETEAPELDAETYAVERDVAVRGVDLPEGIEPINYDTLIRLVLEEELETFI